MIRRALADWPLVIIALVLTCSGIAIVYSAGQTDVLIPHVARAWQRQIAWFAISLVAAYAVSRASVRLLEWVAWPVYLTGIGLLLVTLAFGSGAGTAEKPASSGGSSWTDPNPPRGGSRNPYGTHRTVSGATGS